jgi:hypothetical protein
MDVLEQVWCGISPLAEFWIVSFADTTYWLLPTVIALLAFVCSALGLFAAASFGWRHSLFWLGSRGL